MSRPSATHPVPDDVAFGVVVEAVTLAAGAEAPDWVKITPRGRTETRDGRVYVFEPEKLVARFDADKVRLAIDLDHELSSIPWSGRRASAVGWIDRLEARADGLYGHVEEWLPDGRAALTARTHRYLSPTFRHGEDLVATWLHSVALVAAPALSMPAVASAHITKGQTMEKIVQALGLAAGADETACLAAIDKLRSPEGVVAKGIHDEALAKLAATAEELAALKAEGRKGKVDELIESALHAKKIVPAQREHYAKLCATDEGLAQVTALIAATTPGLAPSGLDTKTAPDGAALSAEDILAKANAKIREAKESGRDLSLADAVAAVQTMEKR